jgi:hypothetical protein
LKKPGFYLILNGKSTWESGRVSTPSASSLLISLLTLLKYTRLFWDVKEKLKNKISSPAQERFKSLDNRRLRLELEHGINHISANIGHHIQEQFISLALIFN